MKRLMALAMILGAAASGCLSERGVKVVSSAASMKNVGDINWDEWKIPVVSVVSGPRTTVWVNKDYLALKRVKAGGSITNAVSALGIYSDNGQGEDFVELEFATDTPCEASKAKKARTDAGGME